MGRSRSVRWKIEAVLAVLCAIATVATLLDPEWIEALGFEPDEGDGSAEWAVALVLAVATAASAVLSRIHFVQAMRPGEGGLS